MKLCSLLILSLLSFQASAFQCSQPTIISEINFPAIDVKTAVSATGEAVIVWNEETNDAEVIKATTKGKQWAAPQVISKLEDSWISLQCEYDAAGNLSVYWQGQGNEGNWPLHSAAKPKDGNWQTPVSPLNSQEQQLVDDSYGQDFFFNAQGHRVWIFPEETRDPRTWQTNYTLHALTVVPGQPTGKKQPLGKLSSSYSSYWLSASPQGKPFAFWKMEDNSQQTKFAASWQQPDGSWTQAEMIDTGNVPLGSFYSVEIAIDSKDNVCLLAETADDEIWALTRTNGRWEKPTQISAPEASIYGIQLAVDADGNFLAAWETSSSGRKTISYAAYKPRGEAWTAPAQVGSDHAGDLILQADAKGRFMLVWQELKSWKDGSVHAILFSAKDRKWSSPTQLSPRGKVCFNPTFALSSAGTGVVTWFTSGNLAPSSAGLWIEAVDVSLDAVNHRPIE